MSGYDNYRLQQEFFSNKEYEIESDQIVTAKAPGKMETTGLNTCTGVIIYDKSLKKGTVAHLLPRMPKDSHYTDLLNEFENEYPRPKAIKVYLGGIAPSLDPNTGEVSQAEIEHMRTARQFIINFFTKLGIKPKQITENFHNTSTGFTVMEIDLSTGEVEYHITEEDPDV